jgi:antirestriction protein ArdC
MSALGQNFAAPIWMTYRQASELNAHVRKGKQNHGRANRFNSGFTMKTGSWSASLLRG